MDEESELPATHNEVQGDAPGFLVQAHDIGPVIVNLAAVLSDRLAAAADRLARDVGALWRGEQERRQIHDPRPLRVRWRPAPVSLTDHWETIFQPKGDVDGPLEVSGDLDQIADVYRRIPSQRLVMLGRAGSGKTVVAVRLVLGLLALEAEVMAAASSSPGHEVVTCAELRLHDVAAWMAGGTPPNDLRLTLPEVCDFLAAAWQMATVGLLDLLSFPNSRPRWREVPRVEFRLTAEHEHTDRQRQPAVADLIDFARFGRVSHGQHLEMAVTIPAVPYLPDNERRTLTRQALAYLGRSFGYLEATTDRL